MHRGMYHRRPRHAAKPNSGLTLFELVAVLAIMGIAAGVLGTLTLGLTSQAENNAYGGAYASLKDQVKADSRLTEGSGLYTTRWDWYLSQTKTIGRLEPGQVTGFARSALIPGSLRYWNVAVPEGQVLYRPKL